MSSVASSTNDPIQIARKLPQPLAVLELLKPVTWFPPMWAFACGVVSSGHSLSGKYGLVFGGVLLAGPLVCAMSQAVNDWYDRHVDAINEPHRPIPSGRVPGRWGAIIAAIWSLLAVALAAFLGFWVLMATSVGLALAWGYSAPPLRFKRNGWVGNAAVGFCYEGLAWFTGAAVIMGAFPGWEITTLAILYSIGAHGIMTLNDFKSISGDRKMGLLSLPVQLGVHGAAKAACWFMALPQVCVIWLLVYWGLPIHAIAVALLLMAQLFFMRRYLADRIALLKEPKKLAALYNVSGVTLFVSGMMVSAFGIGTIVVGAAG